MTQGDSLYHFRARSYDPFTGSWLQRDPLGYVDSMNLHEYMKSDPINHVDPNGEFVITAIIVGSLIGAALAGGAYSGTDGFTQDFAFSNMEAAHLTEAGFWGTVSVGAAVGAVAGLVAVKAAPLLLPQLKYWMYAAPAATAAVLYESQPDAVGATVSTKSIPGVGGGGAGINAHFDFANPSNTGFYLVPSAGVGLDTSYVFQTYAAYGTKYTEWQGLFYSANFPLRGDLSGTYSYSPSGIHSYGIGWGAAYKNWNKSGTVDIFVPLYQPNVAKE